MKIALLGGSFNPPHLGHVLIARQVLDFGGVDEVWFLPNWGQSFEKPVASPEDRLAMTQCIVMQKTKVSTIEIDHKLDGKTINLLPYLPPDNSYVFIIGSDQ
jgi:nicotinate-nucleotide adenylyltransferase